MRTSLAILALLSAVPALVAAYPAYGSGPTDDTPPPTYGSGSGSGSGSSTPTADAPDFRNDGAATLYKAQKLTGKTSPTDYTALPADGSCLELTSLFGVWEGQTRSLVVQEGYKCDFYTKPTCASTPLCLIAADEKITMQTLPKEFDEKIVSVKCEKIETSEPKPEEPKPTPTPEPEVPSSSY